MELRNETLQLRMEEYSLKLKNNILNDYLKRGIEKLEMKKNDLESKYSQYEELQKKLSHAQMEERNKKIMSLTSKLHQIKEEQKSLNLKISSSQYMQNRLQQLGEIKKLVLEGSENAFLNSDSSFLDSSIEFKEEDSIQSPKFKISPTNLSDSIINMTSPEQISPKYPPEK